MRKKPRTAIFLINDKTRYVICLSKTDLGKMMIMSHLFSMRKYFINHGQF